MDRKTIELLFRIECRQHKIEGVKLAWRDKKQSPHGLACANGPERTIYFYPLATLLGEKTIEKIMRHELAHILDHDERGQYENENGRFNAHGKNWRKYCKQLGCPPTAKLVLTQEENRRLAVA